MAMTLLTSDKKKVLTRKGVRAATSTDRLRGVTKISTSSNLQAGEAKKRTSQKAFLAQSARTIKGQKVIGMRSNAGQKQMRSVSTPKNLPKLGSIPSKQSGLGSTAGPNERASTAQRLRGKSAPSGATLQSNPSLVRKNAGNRIAQNIKSASPKGISGVGLPKLGTAKTAQTAAVKSSQTTRAKATSGALKRNLKARAVDAKVRTGAKRVAKAAFPAAIAAQAGLEFGKLLQSQRNKNRKKK